MRIAYVGKILSLAGKSFFFLSSLFKTILQADTRQASILSCWACCLQMPCTRNQTTKIHFFSWYFWLAFNTPLNLMVHSEVLFCSYGCYCFWMLSIFGKKNQYLPRVWLCELVCRIIVIATTTGNWNQAVLGLWVMHILWFIFCLVKGLGLMNLLGFYPAVEFQCFKLQHP